MNPDALYMALEKSMMQYIGVSLIVSFPFIILISQCALALREIAMNTRKEYSVESDYKSLEFVAEGLFYLSWLILLAGMIMIVKSFGTP
jgi:hypothetical protein